MARAGKQRRKACSPNLAVRSSQSAASTAKPRLRRLTKPALDIEAHPRVHPATPLGGGGKDLSRQAASTPLLCRLSRHRWVLEAGRKCIRCAGLIRNVHDPLTQDKKRNRCAIEINRHSAFMHSLKSGPTAGIRYHWAPRLGATSQRRSTARHSEERTRQLVPGQRTPAWANASCGDQGDHC
jgi:hypothetical protein